MGKLQKIREDNNISRYRMARLLNVQHNQIVAYEKANKPRKQTVDNYKLVIRKFLKDEKSN